MEITFEQYVEQNPRGSPEDMKEFIDFAIKEYGKRDCVNWTYSDDSEEQEEETKRYISDSMEALLLYRKYLFEKQSVKQEKDAK